MRRLVAAAGTAFVARELARRKRTIDLRDRVALVTGGSRGLGFALARELLARGARVAICGRDGEALERARVKLAASGGEVDARGCDVGERVQVEELVRAVTAQFGQIDVLVNNAGVIAVGPGRSLTHEDYEEAMRIHFWGTLHPTLAVLPQMIERRDGRIANVTSIGGKISVPQLLSYNPSKFAAVGFSEGLRAELARYGVVVTTVVPGLMRTGSYDAAFYKGDQRLEYTLFAPFAASPFNTIEPARAARRIVIAIARGDAEVTLTLHARLLARANGLAPGWTADALALANRLLPDAAGPTPRTRGASIDSPVKDSFLTAFGRRAQRRYNQARAPADDSRR
jgi:NAD(P)-dependent dehydrogenase (short-subunit alcohol dehydrogenase family)